MNTKNPHISIGLLKRIIVAAEKYGYQEDDIFEFEQLSKEMYYSRDSESYMKLTIRENEKREKSLIKLTCWLTNNGEMPHENKLTVVTDRTSPAPTVEF